MKIDGYEAGDYYTRTTLVPKGCVNTHPYMGVEWLNDDFTEGCLRAVLSSVVDDHLMKWGGSFVVISDGKILGKYIKYSK